MKKLIVTVLVVLLASSCVSNKKFNSMKAEALRLEGEPVLAENEVFLPRGEPAEKGGELSDGGHDENFSVHVRPSGRPPLSFRRRGGFPVIV